MVNCSGPSWKVKADAVSSSSSSSSNHRDNSVVFFSTHLHDNYVFFFFFYIHSTITSYSTSFLRASSIPQGGRAKPPCEPSTRGRSDGFRRLLCNVDNARSCLERRKNRIHTRITMTTTTCPRRLPPNESPSKSLKPDRRASQSIIIIIIIVVVPHLLIIIVVDFRNPTRQQRK